MLRKSFVTAAASLALLAVVAGTGLAADAPLLIDAGGEKVIEMAPIRAELVVTEGLLNAAGDGFEIDGWTLEGNTALFARLKGQQVWILGTRVGSEAEHRVKVDRIERAVAMNRVLPKQITVGGKAVTFDEAPYMHKGTLMLPLRALAEAAGATIEWDAETWTAYVLLADRTAYFTVGKSEAEMYLHAARYLQRNFLPMDQAVVINNGRMFISADALTEILGFAEAVSEDEEALLDLRFPAQHFDVEEGDDLYTTPGFPDLSYELHWEGPRLHVTGKANVPDLSLQLKLDGKVIAQADAQVKEGYYEANLLVDVESFGAGILELVIVDPATGMEMASGPAGNHHR